MSGSSPPPKGLQAATMNAATIAKDAINQDVRLMDCTPEKLFTVENASPPHLRTMGREGGWKRGGVDGLHIQIGTERRAGAFLSR